MKKGLIFNPYLDTLGGGEIYTLSVMEFLIKKGFQVEIAWKKKSIFKKIYRRFNINLGNRVKINKKAFEIFNNKKNLFEKFKLTRNYRIIFYISDGSIPFLFAKKNFIHFQVPFINIDGKSFINQLKLKKINIICNSFFTKKHIDKEYQVKSVVIYPPLSDELLKLKKIKKENIVLSVGRFDEILNAKRQDVLIEVFKKIIDKGVKNWQLILLGGLLNKEDKYFNKLKANSSGYPIEIFTNVSFVKLKEYYQKAKIYWHAAGFDQDLENHPEYAEHFGISVVEAMASGCVPIVFNGGGIPEIVTHQDNGFLWNNSKELEEITIKLINDKDKLREFTKRAKVRSQYFSKKSFEDNLERAFFNNEKNN